MIESSRAERAAWLALLLVAALWRFADLGTRALSHDESLHAYYSHRYVELGDYRHDPLLHGPLLFHAQALAFTLVGDGDAAARLLPALAGVLLVGAPWLFRRELGRRGALAAGVLLLLSPAVAFYSRYLRNDVWCALFALLWARALLDYRARGEARSWRLLAVAMALSFAAKEVAFLTGAGFGAICLLGAAREISSGAVSRRESRWFDLALLQLALVAPYLSALAIRATGADPADFDAAGAPLAAGLWGAAFGAAGLALALARLRGARRSLRRPLLAAFALFWGLLLPLYTALGSHPARGLASGVAGSLGYWLAQHEVERGAQPVFFYALLMALYEPLVWALSAAGALLAWRRLRAAPSGGAERDESLRGALLLTLWTGTAWLGYSLAGERMPWLLVHIVVPSALLAGWWLERRLPAEAAPWTLRRAAGLAIASSAALLLAAGLIGRQAPAEAERVRGVLLLVTTGLALALVLHEARVRGRPAARRVALIGLSGAALLLGARSALLLCFPHAELAVEPLVYAHATPAVKPALAELERASRRLAGGFDLEVAFDFETSWPLAWYLRDYPRARGFATSAATGEEPAVDVRALAAPALLLGDAADRLARPGLEPGRTRIAFDLLWWPVDGYRAWTLDDLPRLLGDAANWRRAVAFYFFRELPGLDLEPWPLRKGAVLYLPDVECGPDAAADGLDEPPAGG